MKSILSALGFMVAFFFAVPLGLRLNEWAGFQVVAVGALVFGAMAAWVSSPETTAFTDHIRQAMRMAGISQKQAAIEMDVPEPVLAAWLGGKEQGSFRIAKLGDKFMAALGGLLVTAHSDGAVVERQELCDLVNAVQVLTAEMRQPRSLRGAA